MKEISIRAGLTHDICSHKISKKSLTELIFFSDYKKVIDEFAKLDNVRKILEEDESILEEPACCEVTGFEYISRYATNFLLNKAVKIDGEIRPNTYRDLVMEVNLQSVSTCKEDHYYDSFDELDNVDDFNLEPSIKLECGFKEFTRYSNEEIKKMEKINNAIKLHDLGVVLKNPSKCIPISIPTPKYNYNTRGHKKERSVLQYLYDLGFDVDRKCSRSVEIYHGIKLNGKPDGIITKSPIPMYQDVCLEIKNMSYKRISRRETTQLYSYYKLFKKPILLITAHKRKIEFRLYSIPELKKGWKSIKNDLINNTNRIKKLILVNNIEKYYRLQKLLAQKFVSF